MNQDELRNKLLDVLSSGLSASSISAVVGINKIDISRFKNGKICLVKSDAERLEKYLSLVHIPDSID